MPNGGVMPCCAVCQWATRQAPSEIYCNRHAMTVVHALDAFCPDLADSESPGLAAFVQKEGIGGGAVPCVYAWVEVQYRTDEHPDLPQYHHKYVAVAPITVYAEWNNAQRAAATAALS